jgi:hypothetical protein
MFESWLLAPQEAPETWADFPWPEWIPANQREQIEKFWNVEWGRGPRAWFRDHEVQCMPFTGERITTEDIFSRARDEEGRRPSVTGRYIHSWNNMGRIVLDDGRTLTISASYRSAARYAGTSRCLGCYRYYPDAEVKVYPRFDEKPRCNACAPCAPPSGREEPKR